MLRMIQLANLIKCVANGLPLLWSLVASAATIPVQDSILHAVAQAEDGDLVLVPGPAVFHEHIVLTKAIRLLGTNSPVIDADGSGTPLTVSVASAEIGD